MIVSPGAPLRGLRGLTSRRESVARSAPVLHLFRLSLAPLFARALRLWQSLCGGLRGLPARRVRFRLTAR